MKNVDKRPVARPKDVSDVSEYHDVKTQEFMGYRVCITTEDNCWPGIFRPNPFRIPSSPNARIVGITWLDYHRKDKSGAPFTYEIEYLFPNVVWKYVFPKLELFKCKFKQNAFKHAINFRRKMLEQKEHLK